MTDVQAQVQSCLDDLVGRGVERGLQVAAYLDGEQVVDAWAGVADPATGMPVDGETLFTVFSCTKGVTATVIHQLAERGVLDYDTVVAAYWPEFGAHGKERITVRHVLSHTAGVPQMPAGGQPTDMADWDGICRKIADLTPLWEPGTATGYHGLTYGIHPRRGGTARGWARHRSDRAGGHLPTARHRVALLRRPGRGGVARRAAGE